MRILAKFFSLISYKLYCKIGGFKGLTEVFGSFIGNNLTLEGKE